MEVITWWLIQIMKKQTPVLCSMWMHDSLQRGAGNKIQIRTVDTDVVVILIGQFYRLIDQYPNVALWVAFGTGKHFSINTICGHLGRLKSHCLPPFHAFTGCDTTSSFFGNLHGPLGIHTQMWALLFSTWLKMLMVKSISLHHFFHSLRDYKSLGSVNEARLDLFCKRNRSLENLPPTQVYVLQCNFAVIACTFYS